jgi:hypothetical protein
MVEVPHLMVEFTHIHGYGPELHSYSLGTRLAEPRSTLHNKCQPTLRVGASLHSRSRDSLASVLTLPGCCFDCHPSGVPPALHEPKSRVQRPGLSEKSHWTGGLGSRARAFSHRPKIMAKHDLFQVTSKIRSLSAFGQAR